MSWMDEEVSGKFILFVSLVTCAVFISLIAISVKFGPHWVETNEGSLKFKMFDKVSINHGMYAGCSGSIVGVEDRHLSTNPPSYKVTNLSCEGGFNAQTLTFAEDNLRRVE